MIAEEDVERVARALALCAWETSVYNDEAFALSYLEDNYFGSVDKYVDYRWGLYVAQALAALKAMEKPPVDAPSE